MEIKKEFSITDFPEGKLRQVRIGKESVCVANIKGNIYAVNDTCSHEDVSLSEGTLVEDKIECWLHGALFDPTNGKVCCGPAEKDIAAYKVTQTDNSVTIDIS